jgi:2-dehydropantoate 2-reductase
MAGDPITLFGTGALATLLGARLAHAGEDVLLVGTWQQALAAATQSGLTVEEDADRWSAAVRVTRLGEEIAPASLVIVLVKSGRTAAVAEAAAQATRPDGLLLTLQNGLGNRETLEAAAGAERAALGVAFLGATLLGPAHVRAGGGRRIVLERHRSAEAAASALARAGFEVAVEEDVEPMLWTKLAANCAINALSALRRVTNGELIANLQDRALVVAAAREVGEVARALGIALPEDPAESALRIARETAGNRSSMLQDVTRGARTEVEALNGAVLKEAEQLDMPAPVNRWLLAEVRRLEMGYGIIRPGQRRASP